MRTFKAALVTAILATAATQLVFADATTAYNSGDNFNSSSYRTNRSINVINEKLESFEDDRVEIGDPEIEIHDVNTGISSLEVVGVDARTGSDAELESPDIFAAFFDAIVSSTKRVGTTNGQGWDIVGSASRVFINQAVSLAQDATEHSQITADTAHGGVFYVGFTEPVEGPPNSVPYSGMVNYMNGVFILLGLDCFTSSSYSDKSVAEQVTGAKISITNGLETDGMDYHSGGVDVVGPMPSDAGDIVGVEVEYLFKDPNTDVGPGSINDLHDPDITIDSYTGLKVLTPKKVTGGGNVTDMSDFLNPSYGVFIEGGEYDQAKWLGMYSGAGILVDIADDPTNNPTGKATAEFYHLLSGDFDGSVSSSNYGLRSTTIQSGDITDGLTGHTLYGADVRAEFTGTGTAEENFKTTYGLNAYAQTTGSLSGIGFATTIAVAGNAVGDANGQSEAYGGKFTAGGADVNYGGHFSASTGSTNYAIYAASGNSKFSGATIHDPSTTNITAASNSITPTRSVLRLTANASYTLTSTPTVANGEDGQILTLVNTDSTDTVTLQSQAVLANSNVKLSANTIALGPNDSITLLYVNNDWIQIGFTNIP